MKKLWFDEKYAYLEHEDGKSGGCLLPVLPGW